MPVVEGACGRGAFSGPCAGVGSVPSTSVALGYLHFIPSPEKSDNCPWLSLQVVSED